MGRLAPLRRMIEISARTGWFVGRLGVRLGWHRLFPGGRAAGTLLGEELRTLFESLGPTFVKIGQILSSRPDLVSYPVTVPLTSLQDSVAPLPTSEVPALLDRAFGRDHREVFAEIDLEPLASASIAQVHAGRLHDGRKVAVKLRRPGIERQVDEDFRLLQTGAALLARLPPMRVMPMREMVEELETPIRQQLDFGRELASLERLRADFRHTEHLAFPEPYPELCTGSALTLGLLEDLHKVTSERFTAEERKTAALAGLRALYRMIFVNGFVHADMHPGNVFLRQWGEMVILDTGLMAELDEKNLQDFVDFFFGLVNNQGEICARIVYENALYRTARCDRAAFEAAIVELVARHSALKSHEFEVTLFVYQLIETQRKHGIRGSTKFIMTVLSMVVFDGICKQLYPDCDFQREARPYLIRGRYRHHQKLAVAV